VNLIKDLKTQGFYTVGITGHRDLVKSKQAQYKQEIKEYLQSIQGHTNKPLMIISPLADGADRLMVEAALELKLPYSVLLPMCKQIYVKDFDEQSNAEFEKMIANAYTVDEVELYYGNTETSISKYGTDRNFQYWLLGKTLAEECDELITLWDQDKKIIMGGTSHVVHMRKEVYSKPLQIIKCERSDAVLC